MAGDVAKISAAQQRLDTLAGGPMTGPVESVLANAVFAAPLVRYRIRCRRLVHKAVGEGLHDRDQRNSGKLLAKSFDCSNIGRIVGRGEELELFHGGQKLVADKLRRIQRAGMDGLEAHRADLREARQRLSGPAISLTHLRIAAG